MITEKSKILQETANRIDENGVSFILLMNEADSATMTQFAKGTPIDIVHMISIMLTRDEFEIAFHLMGAYLDEGYESVKEHMENITEDVKMKRI